MTLTWGERNCREGLNVCINYEFNLLYHGDVVAKRLRAAAHEGDDNTLSIGPNGPSGKNQLINSMSSMALKSFETSTVALQKKRPWC